MLTVAFTVAVGWLAFLAIAVLVTAVRRSLLLDRLLALDFLALLLVGLLAAVAGARRSSFYLDPAVVLALLSFLETLAVSRYHVERRIF